MDENAPDKVDKSDVCFFLEPNELTLKPSETKQIKVYATPREAKLYTDTLVCCIKENPEPVTFKVACQGQKPELVLDKKEFNFKQVLLHRKDSKDIKMTNNTLLPVQWRLEGVDALGEEFACNQTSGIIEPLVTFTVVLHFRAMRPLVITAKEKRALKLLVSSANSFLGFMENHLITVTAEAYDVALEINLPKGNDGCLDFGSVRVNSENKLNCTLKNKGKYPIKYHFLIDDSGTGAANGDTQQLLKYLTVSPASGELPSAYDRNSQNQIVQVIVNAKRELFVKDAPILKCQITEPTMSANANANATLPVIVAGTISGGAGGATNDGVSTAGGPVTNSSQQQQQQIGSIIANIPIKLTVKALLSKFVITPHAEINFGPMHASARRQDKIIIENKGEFDFKFTFVKNTQLSQQHQESSKNTNLTSKDASGAGIAIQQQQQTTTQSLARLQCGVYTITPATGIILQNGFQVITVDCLPEQPGKYEEELLIDITDRDMREYPTGIVYKLSCEAALPGLHNSIEIFEEHAIVPSLAHVDPKMLATGIYAELENRFVFNNVIVGRTAKARFKMINNNKIPVDIAISIRQHSAASSNKTSSVKSASIQVSDNSTFYYLFSYLRKRQS